MSPAPRAPIFPPSPNQAPRTWLITSAAAPVGLALTRLLLGHGDNVVLGASNIEAMAASAAIARAVVTAEQASFGLPVAGMSAIAAGKAPAGMMPTPLKTPTPKGPSVARIISGTPSPDGAKRRAEEFARFVGDEVRNMGWEERCMVVELDGRCEVAFLCRLRNRASTVVMSKPCTD